MKDKELMREEEAAVRTGGSGLVTAGVVIAVVIAAGSYMSFRKDEAPSGEELTALVPPQASAPAPDASQGPAEAANEEAAPAPAPASGETDAEVAEPTAAENAAALEAVPDGSPPTVDEVRIEADGTAVIAGRAEPGSQVRVLVDGVEVARAQADGRGAFAALAFIAPEAAVRVLTLEAAGSGETLTSVDEIILAPAETVVAAVPDAPAAAPETGASTGTATDAPAVAARETGGAADAGAAPVTEPPVVTSLADAPAAAPSDPVGEETAASVPAQTVPSDQGDPAASETAAVSAQETAEEPAGDVPISTSIAVLKSTAEGVSLLDPSGPRVEEIALDTIGYTETGDVQLSGRASIEAASVRVYLNNRTVVNLPVDDKGGWRGDLPDVDAGVYTLRVDALDAAGKVTSRVETPFQREAPAVLAAASAGEGGPVKAVTVQTGDTLWAIARDRYGEGVLYVKVFEANRTSIRDPDLIYPGQVFDLPVE